MTKVTPIYYLLELFMSSVYRRIFSGIFQFCTSHGILGKYLQMRYISVRNHYCKCGQLKTVEQKQLSNFSRCVIWILECETPWEKFPWSLILISLLILRRAHQCNPLQKCKLLFRQSSATILLSQCSPQLREVCASHCQPGLGFTLSTL